MRKWVFQWDILVAVRMENGLTAISFNKMGFDGFSIQSGFVLNKPTRVRGPSLCVQV